MYRAKRAQRGRASATWDDFVDNLHALDWFIACACLERLEEGWRALFHARANRTDALLIDALRAGAVRLFPRDAETAGRGRRRVLGLPAGRRARRAPRPSWPATTASGRSCPG